VIALVLVGLIVSGIDRHQQIHIKIWGFYLALWVAFLACTALGGIGGMFFTRRMKDGDFFEKKEFWMVSFIFTLLVLPWVISIYNNHPNKPYAGVTNEIKIDDPDLFWRSVLVLMVVAFFLLTWPKLTAKNE